MLMSSPQRDFMSLTKTQILKNFYPTSSRMKSTVDSIVDMSVVDRTRIRARLLSVKAVEEHRITTIALCFPQNRGSIEVEFITEF